MINVIPNDKTIHRVAFVLGAAVRGNPLYLANTSLSFPTDLELDREATSRLISTKRLSETIDCDVHLCRMRHTCHEDLRPSAVSEPLFDQPNAQDTEK
jgi:hypothetical protein